MSGICGIVNLDGAPVDPVQLDRMANAASYDEPDSITFWLDGNVGLACLAFQPGPRSLGKQAPAISRYDHLVLIADARIDNREELVRTLIARGGLQENDPTDAELILAAYRCWDTEFLCHVKGACVAAIWDFKRRALLLFRDRAGERVMYWQQIGGSISFGSEPGQLLAVGKGAPDYDLEQILAYLLGQYANLPLEATRTYFRGICRLPESHFLVVDSAEASCQRYWAWEQVVPCPWDRVDAAEALRSCLRAAVLRRIAQRGETGVLLSSGFDSSSIAAQAATNLEISGKCLYAFTWASAMGDAIDERELSSLLIASRRNVVERAVMADELWPLSRYPDAYNDPNDPETNSYPDLLLTTLEMSHRNGVTVLMNGIGGDMVIGKEMPDLALLLAGRFATLWRRCRRVGLRGLGMFQLLRTALDHRLPDWLTPEGRELAAAHNLHCKPVPWRAVSSPLAFRRFNVGHPLNAVALERFDRLSRRTGVRVVAPWHDVDLAQLVLSIPDGVLDLDVPGKTFARSAMGAELSPKLYSGPVDKFRVGARSGLRKQAFLQRARSLITELLADSRLHQLGLINSKKVVHTYNDMSNRGVVMPRLWQVTTLETWLRASSQIGQ